MAGQAVHVITAVTDDDRIENGIFEVSEVGVANVLGNAYCYDLIVQADPGNVGNISIGGYNLGAFPNGVILEPGDSMPISAQNLSQVYIASANIGDKVNFMYFTYRKAAQP